VHCEGSQDVSWESNEGVILSYLRMEADGPQHADDWLDDAQIHCEGIQDMNWEKRKQGIISRAI
jgi:hypothetical protein